MIPSKITVQHVLAAIKELDKVGVPSGRESTRYHLLYEGKRYPPKYVVSLAGRYAIGRELLPNEFNGGHETNTFLQRLRFQIERSGALLRRRNTRDRMPREKSNLAHNERCKECKAAVLALLRKLYGTVEVDKRFDVGTSPEALTGSTYAFHLRNVHVALQKARGFSDFVRSANLPPCDYFVPNPGFILEFDESQHFTPLRALALSQYPPSLPLGFDHDRWVDLCCRIKARDNDPPYRDEQRAWYETIRDFLPTAVGLQPTVRVYAREYPWCELNPSTPRDVELFRQILSERTQFWTITVGPAQNPRFARLVMDGAWAGDLNAARRLLGDVASAWPQEHRVACLCTCGAFLGFTWPEELPYKGNLNPDSRELQILIVAAEKTVRSVLTRELAEQLRARCDYITLGVDTKKDKVSTTYNVIDQPHAELVCLVDLQKDTIHWTGKFYPTSRQEETILRYPDLQTHFVRLDCGLVMILGCHDLSAYSPRGQATARGWRKQVGAQFRSLAKQAKPVAVLHHPHTTVKGGTWRQQWRRLTHELPSVRGYLGTGAYSYRDDGWEGRDDLPYVLSTTQRGDTLNIVVRVGVAPKQLG